MQVQECEDYSELSSGYSSYDEDCHQHHLTCSNKRSLGGPLLGSLGGIAGCLPVASGLVVVISYSNHYWPGPKHEHTDKCAYSCCEMTLSGASKDKVAVNELLNTGGIENVTCLVDEDATKDNILIHIRQLVANRAVIYFSGHFDATSEPQPFRKSKFSQFGRMTVTNGQKVEIRHGESLKQIFLEPGPPRSRLLLTDFCQAGNINKLCYKLIVKNGRKPCWKHIEGWERVDTDRLIHFSACDFGQQAYEDDEGGFFTRHLREVMAKRMTLPDLLTSVREVIPVPEGVGEQQVPQIYSSYKFDLTDVDILEEFGLHYPS